MQNEAIEEMIEHEITRHEGEAEGTTENHPAVQQDRLTLGRVAIQDWSNDKALERMFNYERRIEQSLYKTMGELRAVQEMRQTAADAEAQARADSAKQSQSELTPEELIALAKRIYGDPLPFWVHVKFKEMGIRVDDGSQGPQQPESISAPETQAAPGTPALCCAS